MFSGRSGYGAEGKTKEEGNRYLHMRNSLENIKFLREPEQSECIEIY